LNRREFLLGSLSVAAASKLAIGAQVNPGFRLTDVSASAGIHFIHNNGAFGGKLLPETLGSGCAFLDYDADGWLDILLINGMQWPNRQGSRSTLKLFRNNRNGTFTDVTRAAGLDVELYGMGVAVGDFNNDGYPDLFITCVGQSRLFRNNGKGAFVDVTKASGLANRQALSTSAMWLDYDRDGRLDLFVCNYVKWSPEKDISCSLDGKHKSYCTPEAYRGETCWLFHNRGDGTFEDVTATSGIFDTSSKSLGAAMIDANGDGWLDIVVANDTQPNKLHRNLRNGKFQEVGVESGIAFSTDGKARAGMGIDVGDFDQTGRQGVVITNFDNEMIGLYRQTSHGDFEDVAVTSGIGGASRRSLGFGCLFADMNLDGALDLVAVNGHIDDSVRAIRRDVAYAQSPQLFLNDGRGKFQDVAPTVGAGFGSPKVGRGLACGDFDRDGDIDVLITTNNGPAYLYRNDQHVGNRSIRFDLTGTKSNRDGIGAKVQIWSNGISQTRLVHSGSSYLSQSQLSPIFGVGKQDRIERAVIAWPNGRVEEFKDLATGRAYACVEGSGVKPKPGF
jgi:hypothetical protein